MMAAGKKKPEEKKPTTPDIERSLRDDAEKQITRFPKSSPDLKSKTPEQLIHELRVHQIELETQADELRQAHLELTEARDKYLDLYEFAPIGYLTLNDKALIEEVNLTGATFLGADRKKLLNARFRKFIAEKDSEQWIQYFMNVLDKGEKQNCTLTLKRGDGSTFPARLESIRLTGRDGVNRVRIAFSDITDIWQTEALRESETSYRGLFNTIRQAIYILNPDGTFVDVNEGAEAMYGYAREEFIGRTPEFLSAPGKNDLAAVMEYIKKAFAGEPQLFGFWGLRKGGEIFPKDVYLYKGTYFGKDVIIAVGSDITERKRAELELASAHERLKEAHHLAHIGTWDWIKETDTVTWSKEMYHIAGRDPSLPAPTYTEHPRVYAPASWDRLSGAVTRALTAGEPYNLELELVRPDGSTRWVNAFGGVKYDGNGKVIGLHGTVQDITERKWAEDTLRESHDRFEATIASLDDAVFMVDPATRMISECNAAATRIFGYSREEMVGRATNFLHVDQAHLEQFGREASAIYEDPGYYTREFEMRRKDGCVFPTEHFVRPIHDPDGRILHVVSVVRDITERKLADDVLRKSEQRLNAAQRIAKVGDITWNVETGEVAWSDALYDLMQYDKSEKIDFSRVNAEIHHPDDLERVTKWLNDCIASGSDEITPNEYRIIRKDGKILFVHTVGVIYRGDGNQVKVFLTLQDITDRKQVEEALRYQNEMRQTILNSIPVMVAFFDPEGHYQWINRCWQSTLGWSLEEMLQHKDVFAEFYPDPEYRKYVMDYITRASGAGHWSDFKTRIRNGHVLDTSWINVPLSDGSIIGLGIDITGRKVAEEEFRQSELLMREVFNNANDAVFLLERTQKGPGTYLLVNDKAVRMLGYSREELLEMSPRDIVPGDIAKKIMPYVIQKLLKEGHATFESAHRRKDGSIYPIEVSTHTFHYKGKDVDLSIVRDITERKLAEEELQHALAEKEVLLREVHHRVKNNLAGIISLIGLQASSVTDPDTISLLTDLETRIRSMALVHESLYRTKDLARVNVAGYTENLIGHLIQVYRTENNIRCRIEMEEITMPIETAIPCGLVMTEIVTNSLKYAFPATFSCQEIRGEPCTIALTLQRDGSDYLLGVADNGIGMPEGTDVTMHHSLGLYLIRLIVEHQLRGSLEISTAGGTAYTIRFPEPEAKERNPDE